MQRKRIRPITPLQFSGEDSEPSGMNMSFVTKPTARASTSGRMKEMQLAVMLYLEWISVIRASLGVGKVEVEDKPARERARSGNYRGHEPAGYQSQETFHDALAGFGTGHGDEDLGGGHFGDADDGEIEDLGDICCLLLSC
ncbi:hypothetical protein HYALB_00008012 [Hymenoscyphus albidus]|uniref:Uncharacterized protein n=1 Tax=Hymenoscyphus albidus TaxID=595503 RepID=A0A9N9LFX6_9HELO|nr:hypothetical protein HYALB_00008012 [Hymenoscyphus albidus]